MKNKCIMMAAAIAGLLGFSNLARAGLFDYSSSVGAAIHFPGDSTFSFTPGVNNFKVTDGTAAGLFGEITGTYTIGTITTSGGVSSAPVTGTGTVVIHDGVFDLTANVQWVDILQSGTGDYLNNSGTVNLTGISYGGSNPDLQALAAAGSAIDVLSFQFIPAVSLSSLATQPHDTSFSGTIAYQDCTGQIGDFVWNDLNGNGCQDPGEPGIPGVQVDLYSGCPPLASFVRSTTTDANGKYLFTNLCAGIYSVGFHTPSGFVHTLANQTCNVGGQPSDQTDSDCDCTGTADCTVCVVLPTDNTQDLSIDCGYVIPPCTGQIGDFVWNDLNGNGCQDGGEPGIPGVQVSLYIGACGGASTLIATTTTDSTGHYLFTNLCAGTYQVGISTPAGFTATTPNAGCANNALPPDRNQTDSKCNCAGASPCFTCVTLTAANPNNLNVDCGYVCNGQIGDYVWNNVNGNGCQDANEPGIPNVQVDLYSGCGAGATLVTSTLTGTNGHYLFSGLCAGTYTVSFNTPAGYVHTVAHAGCANNANPPYSNQTDSKCDCAAGAVCGICVTLTAANPLNLNVDCGYITVPTILCAASNGQVGVPYTNTLIASGGCRPYGFAIISGALPPGLTLNPATGVISGIPTTSGTFNYVAQVTDCEGHTADTSSLNCGITIASCPCTPHDIKYNFNGTQIIFQSTPGGSYVWFIGDGKVTGVPSNKKSVLHISSQSITIPATQSSPQYVIPVPDSFITFDPAVTVATTTFDTVNNVWRMSFPVTSMSGNIFYGGVAFKVPAAGLPGGIKNVDWTGTFTTDTIGLGVNWQWSAANYSNFTSSYNSIAPKPTDDNQASAYKNSDHAGTPEGTDPGSGKLWKSFVVGGASGGGGGNYTGSGSSTISFPPCVCPNP